MKQELLPGEERSINRVCVKYSTKGVNIVSAMKAASEHLY